MNASPKPLRWWDLPAASLLIVALVTAATRLVVTDWTEYLTLVQTIVFLGAIAGLAIGQSRFSPRVSAFFALAYGAFAVPWQLGLMLKDDLLWSRRIMILLDRLAVILTQLARQEVVQDSLLFLVLMAVLFWVLGVSAGYTLTRYGNAWRAILPTGIALFTIHSFDAVIVRRGWYLAVYLFFALVLVARMAYLQHHLRWQQSRTALPPHLGLDFIRFTLTATAMIVLFSWTAPALANTVPAMVKASQPLRQSWNEVRDRMDNAFASLRSTVGVVSDYYGSSVLLGRGNRLTDSQVFRVNVPESAPGGMRYYWRARTYDTYANDQWLSTITTSRSFKPQDAGLDIPDEAGRWAGTFEIQTSTYVSTLFSPPQPLWVSRPAQAELVTNSDGSIDLAAFRATPSLNPGAAYQVQASMTNATEAELRAAGEDYPTWVTDRYLQLPESITPRTRELAQEITAGLDTPYDKAVAVTNWLRRNISYSETIPQKPSQQEAIDWFLFDLKQGFCNYYASAEVLLLRSLGVPARWSVGYAQGELLEDGAFLVRQRDAHAWPEVYFPRLGWVEFEPTASQPSIARLAGDAADIEALDTSLSDMEAARLRQEAEEERRLQRDDRILPDGGNTTQQTVRRVATWTLPLLLAAALLTLAWRNRSRVNFQALPIVLETGLLRAGIRPPALLQRWARQAALPPLTKSYMEINRALSRLGSRPGATQTPAERADDLVRIVPPSQSAAQQLVYEYQRDTFGNEPGDPIAARQAGLSIRKLSYQAILRRFLARLQQPRRNERSWQDRIRR